MKKSLFEYQKKVKEDHEAQICKILEAGSKRFNELKKLTGRAPRGLKTTLDDLKKQGKIEHGLDETNGKMVYQITSKGKREFHDIFTLPNTLSWIEKEDGKLISDYSKTQFDFWFHFLPWGIRDDLALSPEISEKDDLLSIDFVTDLQKTIFKELKRKIKNNKKLNDINKKGTIVLGFEIDYAEFIKSINHKDVYKIRDNTTKVEREILQRVNLGKETPKDIEKFRIIMEMRK